MPDREKVTKALEDFIKYRICLPHLIPWAEIADAIAMLKEQEPKAIEYFDNPYTGLPVAVCPNCLRYARQFHSAIEEETHFCPWCGQAVKWGE